MERFPTFIYHYFLDEAGDSTFYGKNRTPILGSDGVSNCFILGLLKKSYRIFENKHKGNEAEFYADLLSHLLKNRINKYDRLVLNVSERTRCTTSINLQKGLDKALTHSKARVPERAQKCKVVFNVQKPTIEPLLNLADYFCWSIQRVFEKGETRFYDYISHKISVVWDIYDFEGATSGLNYYSKNRKLTTVNCISNRA